MIKIIDRFHKNTEITGWFPQEAYGSKRTVGTGFSFRIKNPQSETKRFPAVTVGGKKPEGI